MKLFRLIKNYKCRVIGNQNLEINGLYHKDTEVKENGLFFCLKGKNVDGTDYIKSAINNGAVAIVTECEIPNLTKITQVIVKNARESMSLFACEFFGNPAKKLKIIGVTGTNGKTTITTMISNVLKFANKKVALIGTNGIYIDMQKFVTHMTTPDPIELQYYFAKMIKQKIEYVIMEVSAHALELFKIEGFRFEISVFTNLTEDHLDFFKTMDRYYEAKKKLFHKSHSEYAIINIDDEYGRKLTNCINIPFSTYSINKKGSYFATKIKNEQKYQTFYFNNEHEIKLNMIGKFNVSNAIAAIAVLRLQNIELNSIKNAFKEMKAIFGRFNLIDVCGKNVIIDYAHTPDGLKNILQAVREYFVNKKIHLIFGCGGNRETQKRSKMGEIASKYADFIIISSDNPRFESREKIANDIILGIKTKNYIIELDRAKAIKLAINNADVGDVIIIAGKGSEDYIEENGYKMPYSDFVEVERLRRF